MEKEWRGQTPLFVAAGQGRINVVKVLVESGAAKEKPNMHGANP